MVNVGININITYMDSMGFVPTKIDAWSSEPKLESPTRTRPVRDRNGRYSKWAYISPIYGT